MKRLVMYVADVTAGFLLFALLLASPAPAANLPAAAVVPEAKAAAANSDYIIGSGDVLDISVWKDSTLTRTVVVLPDGTISFPLVGELKAEGKTVDELKQELEKKLARYVSDLVLSVEVKQCNSMMVYVIGRVNSPGRQILNSRVTVLQALAMAGGPNPFAKKNDINILRQDGDKTVTFRFRYDDVVEGENMSDNIQLKRGDVVVVP